MYIKFKCNEKLFATTTPVETKLFDTERKDTGWLLGMILTVHGNGSSKYIDEILTAEAISEITIYNNDETKNEVISGYQKVNLAVIKYADDLSATIEVQLTKWAGADSK